MNIVTYLSESRGVANSARRLGKISQRFGVSHSRMQGALSELIRICNEAGATPTLAVTAILIERYPEFFRRLAASRVDLAVHGFVHTDHALLDAREQYEHLGRALDAFSRLGLAPKGFRHPYLRYNDATWDAAARLGFTHASNGSVHWDVVDERLPGEALRAYYKGLRLYGSEAENAAPSLPRFVHGDILDISASMPDDEAMIDRLGLTGRDAGIHWLRILDQSYEKGELMTLVVHNERVPLVGNSLRALLRAAKARVPRVWLASLSDIEKWWRLRASWQLRVQRKGEGAWRIIPPDDHRATVFVRDAETEPVSKPWSGDWEKMPPWPFLVRSEKEPLVVEGPTSDEHDGRPLVCLGRWPGEARSALAVTSDVDAMSLLDFLRRPLEV